MSKTTVYTGLRATQNFSVGTITGLDGDNRAIVNIGFDINDYGAVYLQNISTGDTASSDFLLGADNDTTSQSGRFINLGINNSNYLGTTAAAGIIKTVSVTAGGTNYRVGDILTISTGDTNAQVEVITLTGSAVATVQIVDNGTNYTTGTKNTTGGSGSACTINVLTLFDFSGLLANDGYLNTSGGHLVLGTDDAVAGKVIKFLVNGLATANERARIDNTGLHVMPVTAVPAGGTATTGLRFSSVANLGVFFGSGLPTLTAAQGSLYIRTDGSSTTTRMYINTNGTTGWTNVVTTA